MTTNYVKWRVKSPFYFNKKIRIKGARQMKLTVKHLDGELIAYIDDAKNLFERRARMIAVKLKEVGAIQKEELPYAAVLAKRTIGEYNRTKGKVDETYTEEMYVYGTPFKTAFMYIVENQNHFFTYFKYLIDTYGEENIEIHRTDENYSAESVVALLIEAHKSVHSIQYVTYEFIKEGSIPTSFNAKDDLRRHFKLTKNELQKALEDKQFVSSDGQVVILKIVSSSVEVDFLKEIERTEGFIGALERAKSNDPDLKEQKALAKQIASLRQELKMIHRLLEEDNHHNQRVLSLKGSDLEVEWKQVARELKDKYQTQKQAVAELLDDGLIELFEEGRIIEFKDFHYITNDIFRIENIIQDLKRYECEIGDYRILVKLKRDVA